VVPSEPTKTLLHWRWSRQAGTNPPQNMAAQRNKRRNVRITKQRGEFAYPCLPWRSTHHCLCIIIYEQVSLFLHYLSSMQIAFFLRCIISPYMCPVRPNDIFQHYHKKRHDFEKKKLKVKWVFWSSLQICPKRFLFYEKFRETTPQMCIGLHGKYPPLFLSDFNETWTFPANFRKIFK
jgi:hypothetical protein